MERTNPITCKTTKSPATAQICKDKISCVTQWRKDVHRWLNCQLNSESTDQFEMGWECFSQGVSTARVVDVAWVKSHLLKTFLVFFNKMLKTQYHLSVLGGIWWLPRQKTYSPEMSVLTPQSREGDLQQEGGTWEPIYFFFYFFFSFSLLLSLVRAPRVSPPSP